MKAVEWAVGEILGRRQTAAHGPSLYGSAVMPVLEFYKGLESSEERRAFQAALEVLLRSASEEERSFAVDVCLGFFVFRNAI